MTNRKIDLALDRLERSAHLTKDGRAWLTLACDPFHDTDIQLAGYPDVLTAATVVQLVKQQIQIVAPTAAPVNLAAGANWDCSVVMFPNFALQPFGFESAVSATGQITPGSGGSGFQTGGLTISASAQGNNLWPTTSSINVLANFQSLNPIGYVNGQGRCIGMGFEVVNTTSELNKQGQVTAWRIPTKWTDSYLYNTVATTPAVTEQIAFTHNRLPPANIANAQLLFGSRSWAAAEGAYVVSRQNDTENLALLPAFRNSAYFLGDVRDGFADTIFTGTTVGVNPGFGSDYYAPFDISGVHFTGLSFSTTLTVNVRWIFERLPGPLELDLVVLATPSACYDPIALELYCQCMRDMPPGVMLKENPLGEWFANALSKVADWAPRVGGALNLIAPGAGAIGNAIGAGSGAVSRYVQKKVDQKKEKLRMQPQAKQPLMDSRSHPVTTKK
jgi:hypothetical protein